MLSSHPESTSPAAAGALFKIAARLRTARQQRKDLSQRRIGELVAQGGLAGFSPARFSRLELGYADATWAEVTAIAGVLGVTAAWLAGREETAKPAEVVPAAATPLPEPVAPPAVPPQPAPPSPPERIPDRAGLADLVYRRLLATELERAKHQLSDSNLPPATWQKWRAYQKAVQQALQDL
jgi:transcriptional regulator with XRE-family HTH domain